MKKLFLVPLLLALLAVPAFAQAPAAVPLLSLQRVSLAGGYDYSFTDKEGKAGVFGAYNIVPGFSLAGAVKYGLGSHETEKYVGVRIRVYPLPKWGE